MSYAEGTTVPIERSKAEVEQLLRKAGAREFISGWDEEAGLSRVQCRLRGYYIRFDVRAPKKADFEQTPGGLKRNDKQLRQALDNEERRRWRALCLIVKAKLELVDARESTIDREFLADIMLPDGRTVAQVLVPQLAATYEQGTMPRMLLP